MRTMRETSPSADARAVRQRRGRMARQESSNASRAWEAPGTNGCNRKTPLTSRSIFQPLTLVRMARLANPARYRAVRAEPGCRALWYTIYLGYARNRPTPQAPPLDATAREWPGQC